MALMENSPPTATLRIPGEVWFNQGKSQVQRWPYGVRVLSCHTSVEPWPGTIAGESSEELPSAKAPAHRDRLLTGASHPKVCSSSARQILLGSLGRARDRGGRERAAAYKSKSLAGVLSEAVTSGGNRPRTSTVRAFPQAHIGKDASGAPEGLPHDSGTTRLA